MRPSRCAAACGGHAVFIVALRSGASPIACLRRRSECAVAGGAAALGAVALALFGGESESGFNIILHYNMENY